ncbi:MAG: DUF1329 domain-containing protein [Vitreoscilla sp.]
MTHAHRFLAGTVLALAALQAFASATADEAAQIGKTLTEVGALRAGNADGSIPAYDPATTLTKPVEPYKPVSTAGGFPYTDPFAAEKPLFSINAANMDKYGDKLNEASRYLLKTYPGYRIDVYPTHRTASLPKAVLENTVRNINSAKLVGDGDGISGAHMQVPFPIPHSGKEAMWNATLRYKAPYERADSYVAWLMDSSGARSMIYRAAVDYEHQYWDPSVKDPEYFLRLVNYISAPASRSGSRDMRVSPLRLDIKEQNAWSYTQGQRRVRLAPEFKYDTVNASESGVKVYDEIAGFDGKMDRFDFKLLGRREMFIPYNAYKAQESPMETVLTPNVVNPDVMRWELHRVWVVEATLKAGARHIYSRRVYYLDEDSWNFALYEAFDQAGKLYRSSVWPLYVAQETGIPRQDAQVFYDHAKSVYSLSGWVEPGMTGWHKRDPLPPNYFSPEALAASGYR